MADPLVGYLEAIGARLDADIDVERYEDDLRAVEGYAVSLLGGAIDPETVHEEWPDFFRVVGAFVLAHGTARLCRLQQDTSLFEGWDGDTLTDCDRLFLTGGRRPRRERRRRRRLRPPSANRPEPRPTDLQTRTPLQLAGRRGSPDRAPVPSDHDPCPIRPRPGLRSPSFGSSSHTERLVVRHPPRDPHRRLTDRVEQVRRRPPCPVSIGTGVRNRRNAHSAADVFTYTSLAPPVVTAISPATGPVSGGTGVVVRGSGFTSTATVSFGTRPASSVTLTGPSVVTVVAPPHAPGAVTVTVTTPSGTSAGSAADQFTYTTPPGGTSGTAGATSGTSGGTSGTPGGTSGTPGGTSGTAGATSGPQGATPGATSGTSSGTSGTPGTTT